ncbi:cryptochrome/photolyase family protein [Spirillospora sp. NBC_01491]|uniref:cryptochrome/photolyase family protein n=1 Tax=Spirillospora sp. NBC_01491 TaxID=2976007 RepID=UPI002E30176D|nr:deoxyribodipyrimidine photo-lyase [Spirillospora sp. NBC_01491]
MDTAIMLFTRDLRVHDHPALAAACEAARHVVPVFVFDDVLLAGAPNRARFLLDSLADLRASLRARGGDLLLRRGDPVVEALRLAEEAGAQGIFLSDDVSRYATRRRTRLEREGARRRIRVSVHPGLTVVPPGDLTPAGGDHYRVFTPYWRVWSAARWRPMADAPDRVALPSRLYLSPNHVELDVIAEKFARDPSPGLQPGGESAGRERMRTWLRDGLTGYEDGHDDLPGNRTSRLSPYLRFGCLSPLEPAVAARERTGGEAFVRQLAWRDFHHQVTAAFPDIDRVDYRPRGTEWNQDRDALDAWREGRTGFPIVDAGMRQLLREGWMHNRARMICASFLTRDLRVDWRHGLAHFGAWLADGDVANDAGNWQWVAGTGNDTRPNRVLNPLRQAARFDPDGRYVREHVPELAEVAAPYVHTPWRLPDDLRLRLGYPAPIVEPRSDGGPPDLSGRAPAGVLSGGRRGAA